VRNKILSREGVKHGHPSTRRDPALNTALAGMPLSELQRRLTLPGNGSADIYWADAGLVGNLRSK
jgi:hypothetical protein